MTIVRSDTFTRANVASGLGVATDGNTWTIQAGGATQNVTNNEGEIVSSSASTFATLGASLATVDAEALMRFQIGDNTQDTLGLIVRWTDINNHWLIRYNGPTGTVQALVRVAGTYTTLSPGYAITPGLSLWYWLRARAQGTTVSFRIWQDGTAEPTTWQEQYTAQTAQQIAGAAGLYGYATATATQFDHFSVDDLTTPAASSSPAQHWPHHRLFTTWS